MSLTSQVGSFSDLLNLVITQVAQWNKPLIYQFWEYEDALAETGNEHDKAAIEVAEERKVITQILEGLLGRSLTEEEAWITFCSPVRTGEGE